MKKQIKIIIESNGQNELMKANLMWRLGRSYDIKEIQIDDMENFEEEKEQ